MNEELDISLTDIFTILKERLWLIIAVTVSVVIMAGIVSFFVIKPTYEAKTSIIVGKPQSAADTPSQYNDVMMYQNLVKTYSEIANSDLVAQGALTKLQQADLTLDQIKDSITVTPKTGTQILIISAKSKSAKQAYNVINAISNSFIEASKKVYPTGGDIQVMDRADIPMNPISPNKKLNLAIAFFLGLMVSAGIAFLLEYADSTIKTESDVEKYLDLPVLGVIPKMVTDIK